MENGRELTQQETAAPEETGYVPRPKRQVWLARIGLVAMVVFLILYYLSIARGGM